MRKLKNEELNRIDVQTFKKRQKTPIVVILDDIRSLNNIGSIFRTSDAFLVEKIYLCGITATPPHKDIRKTALGATESVAWEYIENIAVLLDQLDEEGYTIMAVEQAENATMLHKVQLSIGQKYALIFGNEVKGVSQEVVDRCDDVIEIPQFGTKHSLNIAVSVGMVIWDFWSKLRQ